MQIVENLAEKLDLDITALAGLSFKIALKIWRTHYESMYLERRKGNKHLAQLMGTVETLTGFEARLKLRRH